jgi:hypothetical protein
MPEHDSLSAFMAKILDGQILDEGTESDPRALDLEAEVEVEVETEDAIITRLSGVVASCADGTALFNSISTVFPNSVQSYGVSLVMNRAIKYLVANRLLGENALMGWKKMTRPVKAQVLESFAKVVKGTVDWNSLTALVMKQDKKKTSVLKRNISSVVPVVAEISSTIDTDSNEKDRIVDRVALLACALVDPNLLNMWTDIAAPIPVAERPAGINNGLNYYHNLNIFLIAVIFYTYSPRQRCYPCYSCKMDYDCRIYHGEKG